MAMQINLKRDASLQIVTTANKIRKRLGKEELACVDFSLDALRKVNNCGEWKRDRRGCMLFIMSREALLAMAGVTESNLEQAPEELRGEFETAIRKYYQEQLEENNRAQYKISLSPIEKAAIEEAAQLQGVSWSEYAASTAVIVALETKCLAQEIGVEHVSLWHFAKLAAAGRHLWDAFTPDEVTQAMDKAGISPSQAVKLMDELERMRNARMNPDLMAGGSQQAHP